MSLINDIIGDELKAAEDFYRNRDERLRREARAAALEDVAKRFEGYQLSVWQKGEIVREIRAMIETQ